MLSISLDSFSEEYFKAANFESAWGSRESIICFRTFSLVASVLFVTAFAGVAFVVVFFTNGLFILN